MKRGSREEINNASEKPGKEILIVDGYNVIHASRELAQLDELAHARDRLIARLSEYQAVEGCHVMVVFDGHLVKRGKGSTDYTNNVEIIFSPEGQTADSVIERLVAKLAPIANVTVATSDAVQQNFVFGKGARRKPARELWEEINISRQKIEQYKKNLLNDKNIGDLLDQELREILEFFRRQKY